MEKWISYIFCVWLCVACTGGPSKTEKYLAEQQIRDSVGLADQLRSIAFYQHQRDSLIPLADSLLPLFKYEKNDKYQSRGYYVVEKRRPKGENLRVLVRDDGEELLVYRNGKRVERNNYEKLSGEYNDALERAQHLQIVILDIQELEKRINQTSLEIQKYQKRLQK
jgi:hypothetical protein